MSRLPLEMTTAFILAAGMGVRLRPLTDELPKPLVPIFQKPLITFAFDHLIDAGINRFIVNTHRLPEKFRETFPQSIYRNREILFLHEPDLLETGGGIKNGEAALGGQPFITYSGDLLTDLNLPSLIDEHLRHGNDVTLALREKGLGADIALRNGRVVDICKRYGLEGHLDFAGIAVWNAGIFKRIPANRKMSFIPVLAQWIGENGKIGGMVVNEGKWFNIGSSSQYLDVHRDVWKTKWRPDYLGDAQWPSSVSEQARIASTVRIIGCSVAGANCRIGENALLTDTILWPGAQIARASELRNCVVRAGKLAAGKLENAIV
jgi:mannose-1-phosphate guanylyltransferase